MSNAAVAADRLTVGWGVEPAVRDISFSLMPGEQLALVGTNGSGKSTLLRTVVGLLAPMGGALSVLGGAAGQQPGRVAYLSQFRSTSFVVPLRVQDVVGMGRFAQRGLWGRRTKADRALVQQSMDRMQISDLAKRPVSDLSGGQQQRVYIAQVLTWQADLVVVDEPRAGLDAKAARLLAGALHEEQQRGASVLVATHHLGDAAQCDSALVLGDGRAALGDMSDASTNQSINRTFGLDCDDCDCYPEGATDASGVLRNGAGLDCDDCDCGPASVPRPDAPSGRALSPRGRFRADPSRAD